MARAIEDMAVQGAGDIAITAGFGLYLAARKIERGRAAKKTERLREAAGRLIATRPTGFHLAALLNKLMSRIEESGEKTPASEIILTSLCRVLERQRQNPKTRDATLKRFLLPVTGPHPLFCRIRPSLYADARPR